MEGKTDWKWCYENPHDAAMELDRLRLALRSISNSANLPSSEIAAFADETISPAPKRDTL